MLELPLRFDHSRSTTIRFPRRPDRAPAGLSATRTLTALRPRCSAG
jgi:hypothetical protein